MIRGVHTMFYTSEAAGLREFLRDRLGFTGTDVGDGWLIFNAPEADIGCHPAGEGDPPSGTHYISFYCDDLDATMRELEARGVRFVDQPEDRGYGRAVHFEVPGGFTLELYQPYYEKGR